MTGSNQQISPSDFWATLNGQRKWLTEPVLAWPPDTDDSVYVMQTKPGYIFDDAFWKVFQRFPFSICHVAYFGPERHEISTHEERMAETGVFELRFATRDDGDA